MGTLAVSANVAESMPVSMAEMVEDKPSFTPTEPAKKIPTTLKQVGQRRDYQMIDPRLIDIEPGFNARDYTLPENRAHLDRLKLLIVAAGRVNEPITVRLNRETGRATVVDGECRLRSTLELIAEGVYPFTEADMPCYPAPPGSDDEATRRFASLYANEGKSFSKWELGHEYQALFDLNISIETIAKKTANSVTFIKEAMELASAPDDVKQLLSDAAVSPAEAKRILRSDDVPAAVSDLQSKVAAKKARGEKGPVRRVKAPSVSRLQTKPAPASSNVLPVNVSKAILSLVDDVPADDLNLEENEWVSVNRVKLLKLLSFAITEDDLKAAGVETANF